VTYTITVANGGNAPTSGAITLTDNAAGRHDPGLILRRRLRARGVDTVVCTRAAGPGERRLVQLTLVVNVAAATPSGTNVAIASDTQRAQRGQQLRL